MKRASDPPLQKKSKKKKKNTKKKSDVETATAAPSSDAPKKKEKKLKGKKKSAQEEEEKGRKFTVTIALPGSIIDNAQSPELRTYLAGQIARTATVFNVDEIVVYCEAGFETEGKASLEGEFKGAGRGSDPNIFLARVLQYLETPQYLRKALFPVHRDLKYAGLLNPLDATHHVRMTHDSPYREGVVLHRPVRQNQGSWVNVGLLKDIQLNRVLPAGTRVTVAVDDHVGSTSRKVIRGKPVAASEPREKLGLYWGYTIRVAKTISEIWTQCPHQGGYDLSMGTSENGENVHGISMPPFKHLLIVFGGLAGLEEAVKADEGIRATDPSELFDRYVNTCVGQGSGTIRTEEAIPITLGAIHEMIRTNKPPQHTTPSPAPCGME